MSKKKHAELREEKDWERIDEAVFKSESFLERYSKQLLIAVGIIVVVVCGYLAYEHFYMAPKNKEAQVAMFKGEEYFRLGKDSLAIFGDANGFIGFDAIANQYSSTKAGKLSKAYAGISYARLGKYDEALAKLKDYSGNDKIFSHIVNGTIGDCLVNTGKGAEAIPYFIKAAQGVDNYIQSPILYKKAALLYREQGNYDKVIEIFTLIKNNYASVNPSTGYMGSTIVAEADKYIEEAQLLKGK